jgi:uncharacterized PurR-regulated membrane protein YhhQ (DUF165 family)
MKKAAKKMVLTAAVVLCVAQPAQALNTTRVLDVTAGLTAVAAVVTTMVLCERQVEKSPDTVEEGSTALSRAFANNPKTIGASFAAFLLSAGYGIYRVVKK